MNLSACGFAGLKNVDRLGQLPGAPRAAAHLAQDAPGFELGVGPFTGAAQPGMSAVGVLLRGGLVLALVRDAHVVTGTAQKAAEDGLGDQKGAVVALDVRTGEVLVMASEPDTT